eukprot:11197390-Lingulodinium_polyedra.AAC.1
MLQKDMLEKAKAAEKKRKFNVRNAERASAKICHTISKLEVIMKNPLMEQHVPGYAKSQAKESMSALNNMQSTAMKSSLEMGCVSSLFEASEVD